MLVQPNSAPPQVAGAIRQAASSTGASFGYLLATAQIESNFNPQAQASTSSAQGLFQFIDQTWLATMKEAGPKLGLGNFAANISRQADGRYEVPDPHALGMWLEVDGKRYQNGNSGNMIFRIPFLISYLSAMMSLQPGDIISTGTPAGVGLGQKPPVYLRAGNVIRLGIDKLGEQRQVVRAYGA